MIDWESKLQQICEKIGASHAGVSRLEKPATWLHYENWLADGYAGEMEYLKTHAELKKNPRTWKPALRSAVVIAFPYVDHPAPSDVLRKTRSALYAKGFDYHFWIKEKLQVFIDELRILYPTEVFETHTDSSPLLERDLAQRAGLGWFGKNTCLIHPKKGSLFLLGEILTSLDFELKMEEIPDFCGKCQKCMEVCPTQAITAARVLDASKCISYLTIESKKIPPENLRKSMGDWFFGCDICQTACPWNQKVFKHRLAVAPAPNHELSFEPMLQLSPAESDSLEADLRFILSATHNQILKKVKGTPYYRAGAKGLKRNALIVVANRKLVGLQGEVLKISENSDYPDLSELAKWTLKELT